MLAGTIRSLDAVKLHTASEGTVLPGRSNLMDDELRKIMGCTCMRMRRATRRVTQLYDLSLIHI